ncbi:uncharacterized protein LOC131683747 isoform X1 [Topomyia yanbarensis]|uniref:uncharacterized protein LOC131683747 isoform X1 n=2 Tax=Topomyia yanbarensis TaxID=2498891 RepID=UPI00273BCD6A|nr:uncharacterized protein LOC131683747 isoform X1 [Topomyia yanbarensis]
MCSVLLEDRAFKERFLAGIATAFSAPLDRSVGRTRMRFLTVTVFAIVAIFTLPTNASPVGSQEAAESASVEVIEEKVRVERSAQDDTQVVNTFDTIDRFNNDAEESGISDVNRSRSKRATYCTNVINAYGQVELVCDDDLYMAASDTHPVHVMPESHSKEEPGRPGQSEGVHPLHMKEDQHSHEAPRHEIGKDSHSHESHGHESHSHMQGGHESHTPMKGGHESHIPMKGGHDSHSPMKGSHESHNAGGQDMRAYSKGHSSGSYQPPTHGYGKGHSSSGYSQASHGHASASHGYAPAAHAPAAYAPAAHGHASHASASHGYGKGGHNSYSKGHTASKGYAKPAASHSGYRSYSSGSAPSYGGHAPAPASYAAAPAYSSHGGKVSCGSNLLLGCAPVVSTVPCSPTHEPVKAPVHKPVYKPAPVYKPPPVVKPCEACVPYHSFVKTCY